MTNTIKKFLPGKWQPALRRWQGWYRLARARRGKLFLYSPTSHEGKTRVFFYDAKGLIFAGSQKFMQILARHLDKNQFEVYYMYSPQFGEDRLDYFKGSGVKLISFSFRAAEKNFPYRLHGAQPDIFETILNCQADILVATGAGYPEFPVAAIANLPIIHVNIFGSVNPQKNIVRHFCISDFLTSQVAAALPERKVETFYIQSEGPDEMARERGRALRGRLGLSETDFVFGRIGRPDDRIFDPIGIRAFQKVVANHPNAYYLIMAPPPALERIVIREKIPNVYFLPPTGDEQEVWAFHSAIDVLAHFRRDGETMGLNIGEAMLCGKPVISHRSFMWNAHLEFLDNSFSRIADLDDIEQYAGHMEFFLKLPEADRKKMGALAREKAEKLFLIKNNIGRLERSILAK